MWRKIIFVVATLFFAFGILFISILRTASVKYEFGQGKGLDLNMVSGNKSYSIIYYLAYPGKVLPDSPLWRIKAARDRVWLLLTTNKTKKIELLLLFSDKRLGASNILFDKGKPEVAYSTLTKGEKYMEEASIEEEKIRKEGVDTTELVKRLANASLKHYEVIDAILATAPEDAIAGLKVTQNISTKVYERSRNALLEKGIAPPDNPFNWQ